MFDSIWNIPFFKWNIQKNIISRNKLLLSKINPGMMFSSPVEKIFKGKTSLSDLDRNRNHPRRNTRRIISSFISPKTKIWITENGLSSKNEENQIKFLNPCKNASKIIFNDIFVGL